MAEGEGVYNDNIHVLKKVMGLMLNNQKFSDAVFSVKDQQFFVLSHLLAASSTIFDTMMSSHYEHCNDKDMKIYNIKHEDSFLLILKYIYGQSLDFHTTPVHVICEVLSLAERYQLSEFHNDLKRFLSTLNCFELESAVVLLNTANKYNLSELYERLTVFAFQHAEQLVKHHTFPDLDYNVLTDLVQSDWFACSEIDILTGVLTWHSGMDRERHNWKTNTSQDDIDTEHDDTSETNPSQSDDEVQDSEHIDHLDLNNKNTCTSTDNSKQLVEKREQILKSLLAQIRFPKLVLSDVLRTMKTELGNNYIDFLLDETYFSKSSEPRRKYKEQSSEATRVINNNVTKIFQIKSINWETMPYSEEEYLLGDLKWKISLKWTLDNTRRNNIFTLYLKCTSDNHQKDWECTFECQLKWISHDNRYNSMILPDDNSYTTLTLTGDTSCVEIGKWEEDDEKMTGDWWKAFEPNGMNTFHLVIKSMQTNMNGPIEEIHNANKATTAQCKDNNATVAHDDGGNNNATTAHDGGDNTTTVQHRDNTTIAHDGGDNTTTAQDGGDNSATTAQDGGNNATTVQQRVIYNVTKTFQIQSLYWDTMLDSDEEYLIGDLKWKICLKKTLDDTKTKHMFTIYLLCTSDSNQNDWECTVECRLKWISHYNPNRSKIVPDHNSYKTLTLTRDTSCVEIMGREILRKWVTPDWWREFHPKGISTFYLIIKSMQTKMNGPIEEIRNVSLANTAQCRDDNNATIPQDGGNNATTVQHIGNSATTVQQRVINNVTKTFQIHSPKKDSLYHSPYKDGMFSSEEEYLIGDLKWKILSTFKFDLFRCKNVFTLHLLGYSDNKQLNFECTVECQLELISNNSRFINMILPHDNSYTTLTLTSDSCIVKIGEWEIGVLNLYWGEAFRPNLISTFHLVFKSMQTKIMQ